MSDNRAVKIPDSAHVVIRALWTTALQAKDGQFGDIKVLEYTCLEQVRG